MTLELTYTSRALMPNAEEEIKGSELCTQKLKVPAAPEAKILPKEERSMEIVH